MSQIEKVQRRFTKRVFGLRNVGYTERLNRLGLQALETATPSTRPYFLLQNRFRFNIINLFGLLSVQQQHKYQRSRLQTIHGVPKKVIFLFFKWLCQKLTDFNVFWCVKSWENLTSIACTLFHLTLYCSHFTLGNPKSHFSTVLFIHTSDYLRYVRRKQTVTSLPTTPAKFHRTTL